MKILLFALALVGCSALDKDNEPKDPPTLRAEVSEQAAAYRPLVASGLDGYGLAVMGGSTGDSALFSCLARVAGGASFDPMVLFVEGKPRRHPTIRPSATPNASGSLGTPISKDMVNGFLWCAWDVGRKGDKAHALRITQALIDFGRSHADPVAGWFFCDDEDRDAYQISDVDWLGRCLMPPAVVKDIYRVHKWAGGDCDDTCRYFSAIGTNLPDDRDGFERHLAVLTTMRNGLVEGALNDNSLKQLEHAAAAQPRNALYQAAYHLFGNGDQEAAFGALQDAALFPASALPTSANYCTDYLFQRDDDSAGRPDGKRPDWAPCGDGSEGAEGRGIDFIFAASVALGELL